MASEMEGKGKGIGGEEVASAGKEGIGTEMVSGLKGNGNGGEEVASEGKGTDPDMASGMKGKGVDTEMASEVIGAGNRGPEMASGMKSKETDTDMASGGKRQGNGGKEMASEAIARGNGGPEMASEGKGRGTDTEMASGVKGSGIGGPEMASGVKGKGTDTDMASGVKRQGNGGKEMASKAIARGNGGPEMASERKGKGTDTELASEVIGTGNGGPEMASGVKSKGTDTGMGGQGIVTPETGAAGGAPPRVGSWIQRTLLQAQAVPQLRLSLPDAQPVTVLALQRYLADLPPPSPASEPLASWPAYYYDVTLSDGAYQERCHLCPALNPLVQKNALRCGLRVKVTKCFYTPNENKLGYGFLCVEGLEILGASDSEDTPQEQKECSEKPPVPLKGAKKHYLPLWNNEDPCGEMWVARKPSQEVCVDVSKLTSLLQLEQNWKIKLSFKPLLVRIMHKARLRYYGKPETKLDVPYQAYFEVADHSGMMSMVLWNSLCPEWYNSMKIGTVLLLEQYAIKSSYPFKTQPTPGDLHMKKFSSIG